MKTMVRLETPADYRRVEEITRDAFWNLYCPGASEHWMVHTMRAHPDFIPELTFVIEQDGELVGSIFYSHSKVVAADGTTTGTLSFGPVSIRPELHRQGLGRVLITHSMEAARQAGHRAILIGGFPYHYHPYGFIGAKKYNIRMPDGKFYTGIMALPLVPGGLDGVSGSIHFSPAMYPAMDGFDAYDQTFPDKEKQVLPCQAAFEAAAAELDTHDYAG